MNFCFKYIYFSCFSLLFFLNSITVCAQNRYWIFFKDKDTTVSTTNLISKKTIELRELKNIPLIQLSDFPINKTYSNILKSKYAIKIGVESKWLNAVSCELKSNQLEQVKNESFVKSIEYIKSHNLQLAQLNKTKRKVSYRNTIEQMNAKEFVKHNLHGKNILIGITDAGYKNAEITPSLKHLFKNKSILASIDYWDSSAVDTSFRNHTDTHGKEVLKMIAGYRKKEYTGCATKAKFYLTRTENSKIEVRTEEEFWIKATEWLDSVGVQIINTSLGYAKDFDDKKENYLISQMDGKTSMIARAAQIAVNEKGIFVVVAAGNEGSDPDWRIIASPADAADVLTVGATKLSREKAGYSSIGPDYLNTKPDVACYSPNGTSFSAPSIAGFAACLLEYKPSLKPLELKELIIRASHLYPYSNNYVGFGIPDAQKALNLVKGDTVITHFEIIAKENEIELEHIQAAFQKVVIFHKKNNFHVLSQTTDIFNGTHLKLERPEGVLFTTVDYGTGVLEIKWINEQQMTK